MKAWYTKNVIATYLHGPLPAEKPAGVRLSPGARAEAQIWGERDAGAACGRAGAQGEQLYRGQVQ